MDYITVVVETPKGSAQKYNYDPITHFFKLKKILPAGMVFPYDFGFIPETKGGDGDPLDVIVISEFGSFAGCIIECKLIGAIQAEQTGKDKKIIRNDRFIAIPKQSEMFKDVDSISDISDTVIKELEDFFVQYNKLQGKDFKPLKKLDAKLAMKQIKDQQAEKA